MILKNVQVFKSVFVKFFPKNIGGQKKMFIFEDLKPDKFEEFLDFQIKYYVGEEVTHREAGIIKNPAALAEYREVLGKRLTDDRYKILSCRPEDSDQIVAFTSVKLLKKDVANEIKCPKTPEVELFYKFLEQHDRWCSPQYIMSKYGVDKMFEDYGGSVHPDYRGLGINNEIAILRRKLCQENQVPLIGSWITSLASMKSVSNDNWETVMTISRKENENVWKKKMDFEVLNYVVWKDENQLKKKCDNL